MAIVVVRMVLDERGEDENEPHRNHEVGEVDNPRPKEEVVYHPIVPEVGDEIACSTRKREGKAKLPTPSLWLHEFQENGEANESQKERGETRNEPKPTVAIRVDDVSFRVPPDAVQDLIEGNE